MASTPTNLDPIAVTIQVTRVLDSLNVPYFIGGSLASSFHGMVRTTQDADIIAKLEPSHAAALAEALQDEFFVDVLMVSNAIRARSSFNILHKDTFFKIDIFIPAEREFTRQQFARSKTVALSLETAGQAAMASAEDTILAKLEWFQQGGEASERQWRDILGLLQVQGGTLEMAYLEKTAVQLGLGKLLAKAIQSASNEAA